MKTMRATIYYVDNHKTTRDQRFDASVGAVLPEECYEAVDSREVPDDGHLLVCEALFELYQAIDSPLFNSKGIPVRSMSVGDVVEIEGCRYVCKRLGFEALNHPQISA